MEWSFKEKNVEFNEFDSDQIISAASTLIAAGKPKFGTSAEAATAASKSPGQVGMDVYPIGLIENFGLSMGTNIQRIFEIGSMQSILIPGRMVGTATIARIVYDKKTLLRVLYAYYKLSDNGGVELSTEDLENMSNTKTVKVKGTMPGYDNVWYNLNSDVFKHPIGLAILFADKNDDKIGGLYLQNCYIGGSQLTINAGTELLAEGVNLQFIDAVPIKISTSTS